MKIGEEIKARFRCPKCGSHEAIVKKLAITGAGIFERWMNWQRNRYYFVSCANCGYTEVYSADVLEKKRGKILSDLLDLLFGT